MNRCVAAFVLVIALALATLPASAQNRLAFVVGNDAYQNIDPLKKAANDARSMAQGLQRLGFQVTLGENLKRRDFIERFNAFENSVGGIRCFCSIPGTASARRRQLSDPNRRAKSRRAAAKPAQGRVDLHRQHHQRLKARGTKSQIVVLDACRENPFRQAGGRSVGGARGLAPTQTPGGVFVIYSAGVGEVALDRLSDNDADPNSVFTRSFLPLLTDPAQSLVSVAKETRLRVKRLASTIGMTQSPAYYDEIDGDLFLARTGVAVAAAPIVPEPPRTVLPPPATPPTNLAKSLNDPSRGAEYGYIFANSDRMRLTPDMLRGLTRDQLRLARNEIYARRGRSSATSSSLPISAASTGTSPSPGRSRSTRSSRRTSISRRWSGDPPAQITNSRETKMPYATTADSVRLYFEEAGSGTPIIFLHEFAADHTNWEPQMRYFSRRHRCIAYSARGYTPSDVPSSHEVYSYKHFYTDALAVLDQLKIEKSHFVGLSMGAYSSLQVGLNAPNRPVADARRRRLRLRSRQPGGLARAMQSQCRTLPFRRVRSGRPRDAGSAEPHPLPPEGSRATRISMTRWRATTRKGPAIRCAASRADGRRSTRWRKPSAKFLYRH